MSETLPTKWKISTFVDLMIFALGGDWGKKPESIKNGWESVTVLRGTEFKNWSSEKGKTAVHRIVKEDSLDKRELLLNDFVIEISGGGPNQPVGRVLYIDEQVLSKAEYSLICSNFCRKVRLTSLIVPKYVYFNLNHQYSRGFFDQYQNNSVNIRNLQFDEFCEGVNIPLPPLNEQKRITAKLDHIMPKIDGVKERLDRIPRIIKRFRQSVLTAAVTGKLTEKWREENPEVESAHLILENIYNERNKYVEKTQKRNSIDIEDLPNLPNKWCWCTWEDYLDYTDNPFRRGPFGSALKKEIFVSDGYKVYEQYCPINDDCSFARYYITEEKYNEMINFSVKENDYLISCSGVTLGRITKVPEQYEKGVINQALLRVRINGKYINHDFFLHLFRSPFFQSNIFDNSTGSAIPNVKGVKELKSMPVPLLSLSEQKEIVRQVDKLFTFADKLELHYKKAKEKIDKLPQSVLAKAFRGELVPQDPNDEPAEKLLERIKEEKARIENKKNTRRARK